jgi:hypothetical protein
MNYCKDCGDRIHIQAAHRCPIIQGIDTRSPSTPPEPDAREVEKDKAESFAYDYCQPEQYPTAFSGAKAGYLAGRAEADAELKIQDEANDILTKRLAESGAEIKRLTAAAENREAESIANHHLAETRKAKLAEAEKMVEELGKALSTLLNVRIESSVAYAEKTLAQLAAYRGKNG